MVKTHKSHISSKASRSRGWSRVPPPSVRAETYLLNKEVGTEYMSGNYISWCNTDNFTSTTYNDSTTGSSNYWVYPVPNVTWYENWYPDISNPSNHEIEELKKRIKELEVKKMTEKRTLFRVYVIDPRKSGRVLMNGELIIAENENQAMLKAGVSKVASDAGRELEQVDVYVEEIATFIRPRKEIQRVKITKDEEDE